MRVLVTGANGFVGGHLCRVLETAGVEAVRAVRNPQDGAVAVGSIDGATDWSAALPGVEVVVHLAARVHIVKDSTKDPLSEFRKVNVDGTLNLARQAAQAGAKRFIFVSSIAVHGLTSGDHPFTSRDIPAPHDAYGASKHEAEEGLRRICADTGLERIVIRPPLVYGPGVGANFLKLMKLAGSGIPLPLGAIHNRRNPVYVGNLCDLILQCLTHPAASGQTFLVSDNQDVSTPELLQLLASEMKGPVWLVPVPEALLRLAGRLAGRSGEIARLCGSLQVDITHTRKTLGWEPPFTMEQGIHETVAAYLAGKSAAGNT